jgi:hypothetical protein
MILKALNTITWCSIMHQPQRSAFISQLPRQQKESQKAAEILGAAISCSANDPVTVNLYADDFQKNTFFKTLKTRPRRSAFSIGFGKVHSRRSATQEVNV